MRALGLPNTKHFHEITKISDALAREFRTSRVAGTLTTTFAISRREVEA